MGLIDILKLFPEISKDIVDRISQTETKRPLKLLLQAMVALNPFKL